VADSVSEAELMRRIREKTSPADFGLENIRNRKAVNGGILIEFRDPDASDRVAAFADRIGVLLDGCAMYFVP